MATPVVSENSCFLRPVLKGQGIQILVTRSNRTCSLVMNISTHSNSVLDGQDEVIIVRSVDGYILGVNSVQMFTRKLRDLISISISIL
jgi:hypothetical protein